MNKKAQVLIISLWVLVILSILAAGIGHRVSLALRLSRYQRDSLKALYLAKAAESLAISRIMKDNSAFYDALNESWADDEKLFNNINIDDYKDGFARVIRDNGFYGASDEESRVNINLSGKSTLVAVFEECGIDSVKARELSENVLIWIGKIPPDRDTEIYYKEIAGYPCKGRFLTSPEELILVKGMNEIESKAFMDLKALISVYGNGKININTASLRVLKIICRAAAREILADSSEAGISDDDAASLAQEFVFYRQQGKSPFEVSGVNTDSIRKKLELGDVLQDNRVRVLDRLVTSGFISAVSDSFRIEAEGNVNNVSRRIVSVVKRDGGIKRVFWHED